MSALSEIIPAGRCCYRSKAQTLLVLKSQNLKRLVALLRTSLFPSLILLLLCSLGCGIGYGYLHRIPTQSVVLKKKSESKPPSPLPDAGTAVPSTNGYTEVCEK